MATEDEILASPWGSAPTGAISSEPDAEPGQAERFASAVPALGPAGVRGSPLLPGPPTGGPDSVSLLVERCLTELVRSYRHSAVGQRVTGIVHNLNTPLQVLSFQVELLAQKAKDELRLLKGTPSIPVMHTLRELLDYRLKKLQQLSQEVERLQTQVRLLVHHGLHEDHESRQYLDLNRIYREELDLYQANAFFKHQVRKEVRLLEGLPHLSGHYIDFSQSFRFLVDNALEAMEGVERRILTVETRSEEGLRLVRIGDTGVGVAPEVREHLFEPFCTTKTGGPRPHAGLGLFMARRLLAPYRGSLHLESRPGETWVTVSLPV